jgi:threonine/homoserine/homoserine lactone efflux protein
VLSFVAVALVVIASPGPDFVLVTRNVLARGRAAGFATLAGLLTGVTMHVSAAVFGVSALLATSATAFTVLKVAGGAYLVVLGLAALRDAAVQRRRAKIGPAAGTDDDAGVEPAVAPALGRDGFRTCWRQGFLSNALNPKVALFFVTFVPQFVEPGPGATFRTAGLSLLYLAMATAWLVAYIFLLARVQRVLRRPSVQRRLEAVSGAALAGLGGRLLLASS